MVLEQQYWNKEEQVRQDLSQKSIAIANFTWTHISMYHMCQIIAFRNVEKLLMFRSELNHG